MQHRLFLLILTFALAPAAFALETQVFTGIYYFPADAAKRNQAEAEQAEDGLSFAAPREEREAARDYAQVELRQGNVCLRQLRAGLRAAVKHWDVRHLCGKFFESGIDNAVNAAAKEKLHPDHFECRAEIEAREHGEEIEISLLFRGTVVMQEQVPAKLRNAGFAPDSVRRELSSTKDSLGAATGGWKAALKAGACNADGPAMQAFWDRAEKRAAKGRELAECQRDQRTAVAAVSKLQRPLRDYVPEEWVNEAAADKAESILAPLPEVDSFPDLAACTAAREEARVRLEQVQSLSTKIADRHEVPALAGTPSGRSPASDAESGD